ncbi:DNA repair protein RecN [Desulfonatronovibrio hydrogenovorans]|uniref:DNA repair protein RecN n=1 Tax=Desulfonatronovibrio hydrogenovorans TaxID=53245 RepID=UPI00048B2723|nr:AAA family ATPase [Desulfonatronovibrio hydrogenovorans]
MLEILRIKNLALIEDMELEFHPGLNVLTGESGAGKSFILKALDFILGERIKTSMIRPGKEKAMVEALFAVDGQEIILKRELVSSTGRSRFLLNDSLASQDRVQGLREKLLIHTSQHGQQKLLKRTFHQQILDSFLADKSLLNRRNQLLAELQKISSEQNDLAAKLASLTEKRDYLEFQRTQIDKVKPRPGEEEELIQKRDEIKTRAEVAESVHRALEILHSPEIKLLDSFYELKKVLTFLSENNPHLTSHTDELENFQSVLEDVDRTLRSTGTQSDTAELESVESRLWELAQLRRKLNRSLEGILSLHQEIEENISFLDQGELSLKQLQKKETGLKTELLKVVAGLDDLRFREAEILKASLEKELGFLGFSGHVRIEFQFSPEEIYPDVQENKLRLLWVPNPGQPAQPLDMIASGGELSRFLLALVGLRSQENLPTLLFDEVDAGIGGTILNQVGERIRSLAQDRQILLITHWAQLACLAQKHFLVRKRVVNQETYTLCTSLNQQESKQELARMVGGEKGLELAEELKHEAAE